jgi:predicted LPLAT superfamily acyltransferase
VTLLRRFVVHGVFWRRLLRWGVLNLPLWVELTVLSTWSVLFLLLWGSGRRGVMSNLKAILPGSTAVGNLFRCYRVFWNFSNVIADNVRFKELRVGPDWEFSGSEYFEELQSREGGAIILTAHMGSYDIGAQLFAEIARRPLVMVRAPETDPETHRYEEELHDRTVTQALKIDFSTRASALALDLLHALQRGEIIAIQGDRVTPGISTSPGTLFGKRALFPSGPFALAMTARVPIYPLFIVRMGRRRYRLVAGKPFEVQRTRDRAESFERAMADWTQELETIVRQSWFQWFAFQPFADEART